MSEVIPRSKQTAYERYELMSFAKGDSDPTIQEPETDPLFSQKDLDDIENAKENAHRLGYEDGFLAGKIAGEKAGQESSVEEFNILKKSMEDVLASFESLREQINREIPGEVLKFSLLLSNCLVNSALKIQPELVLNIIEKTLKAMPIGEAKQIRVNPSDAINISKFLVDRKAESENIELISDSSVEIGGCIMDTETNQIDATVTSRWSMLTNLFNEEPKWLLESDVE